MYTGGNAKLDLSTEAWLEWEAAVLRPAVYSGDAAALAAAVQQLMMGLAGKKFLQGAVLSLADIIVYCSLQPLSSNETLSGVKGYLEGVAAEPAIEAATMQVLLGQPADALMSGELRQGRWGVL
jgi:hypothetical protein